MRIIDKLIGSFDKKSHSQRLIGPFDKNRAHWTEHVLIDGKLTQELGPLEKYRLKPSVSLIGLICQKTRLINRRTGPNDIIFGPLTYELSI